MAAALILGIGASFPVCAQDTSATGNAHMLKATVELVYQCKLVADEAFIRRAIAPENETNHPVARCGGTAPLFVPRQHP